MTWVTLILYSKKAWIWCKHHWKILALALWTLVVFVVARRHVGAYKKVLETTIENYNKEVEILEGSHKGELEKRNDAIESNNEALARLEADYSNSTEELNDEKRTRYLDLLQMFGDDPENVNKILEEEFGFKHEE